MKLINLEIHNLYDSMNLRLNFNDKVTMLVGINGTGKTSALNAIDWLLKPNLHKLATTAFTKIILRFNSSGQEYTLKASKTKAKLTLSINGGEVKYRSISVDLMEFAYFKDDLTDELSISVAPAKHELPLWNLIKSFTKPISITLDRSISAEIEDQTFEEPAFSNAGKKTRKKSPLIHVQDVTSQKYAEFRKKAISNDGELKARLAMSALQTPLTLERDTLERPMSKVEIRKLKTQVTTYLSESIKSDQVSTQVDLFFAALTQLEDKYRESNKTSKILAYFIHSQYKQAGNMANAFNDFETKNANAFKDLKVYIDSVNLFFRDSGKNLCFDTSTGQLVFSMLGQDGRKVIRSIAHLSSGERQILILFTFLAFIAKSNGIFIVDEPEISLHPKWQNEFMPAFLELCPEDTQLLIATHSPEIVGKYKETCVTPEAF